MNDKQDEERHDHKHGEQQRGGNAPAMRQSKLVGAAGIGPGALLGGNGGSKTPIPVRLRGGPPPRAEAGCGSSSNSFSAKSQGTVENATP